MSNSLNQVALTFVQIVLNNSLTYYGALSPYGKEIPLAACGIVMKTNAILLAVIIGISQAPSQSSGSTTVQNSMIVSAAFINWQFSVIWSYL